MTRVCGFLCDVIIFITEDECSKCRSICNCLFVLNKSIADRSAIGFHDSNTGLYKYSV